MKILIIKLGFSETLDPEIGKVSSLGDVLRTTPILYALKEKYLDSNITWLTDESAAPLLHYNPYIDRLLIWDSFIGFQLMSERYDIVINLEKIGGLCALSNHINAWKKYGFRFDETTGSYDVYEGAEYALDLCLKHNIKKNNIRIWQEILVEMVGVEWAQQPYILGYKPKTKECFDVGFNYKVGTKFPEKAWSEESWKTLESMLTNENRTFSYQQGLSNLYEYIDWINSCKTLITCDSLGLHIALALNKTVIGLFGPTNATEVFFYGRSSHIKKNSMHEISPEEVFTEYRKADYRGDAQ
ncbi:glycosyltransferase family 9 protein [Seleniivibrio woodruffii]|uniref:glycosyltransferase family 9 protein n=1 Tax=Seleniivibrio woodruffii TaxID=1078050 RepID=UPI0039E3032B